MYNYSDLQEWDPLSPTTAIEAALADEMQRQTIRNILGSYTGFFDLFSELIQNSLDACDMRAQNDEDSGYQPMVWIYIDIQQQEVSVADNGIGLSKEQLKLFLQPNMTFKRRKGTRGNKGVGATFLAYGFDYLLVATKVPGFEYAGVLENGRSWTEDVDNSIVKPRIRSVDFTDETFESLDRGTYFKVKLIGQNIRPKDLAWIQASTAQQWDVVLRVKTPLGGLYFSSADKPRTIGYLKVVAEDGSITELQINRCDYYYPHEIPACKFESLGRLIAERKKALGAGKRIETLQHLYRLHGIYDVFSAEEIVDGTSEINPRFTDKQKELMQTHKPDVYVFFGYSPQLWDIFNDDKIKLRQKNRILKGGLQLATQNMAQGQLLVIPLTSSIGYQNQTHVIVHFRNADPDLGRKGFQPELAELAESLSTASVTAFKKYIEHLRKDAGEPQISADADRFNWIKEQEERALKFPLSISGVGLFAPEEVIPIQSAPQLEQDVIALFHQLLAGGVIRGFRILATSGHQIYDSIYRINLTTEPKFVYDSQRNPLGIPLENIQVGITEPKILEYKYSVDALIADFERETKYEKHINLVVAWTIGERWKERYQVIPLLHKDYLHRRYFHGISHDFLDYRSGERAFYGIILEDIIRYLQSSDGVQEYLREKYIDY